VTDLINELVISEISGIEMEAEKFIHTMNVFFSNHLNQGNQVNHVTNQVISGLILILVSVSFFSVEGKSASNTDTASTDTSQDDTTTEMRDWSGKELFFHCRRLRTGNLENTNSEGLAYNFTAAGNGKSHGMPD
jgi:hypothetical protein